MFTLLQREREREIEGERERERERGRQRGRQRELRKKEGEIGPLFLEGRSLRRRNVSNGTAPLAYGSLHSFVGSFVGP